MLPACPIRFGAVPAAWDEELDAARIVEGHLGGVSRPRDPGGGAAQLHDFEVVLPDGRIVAVEVTRHTVPEDNAARAAVKRKQWQFGVLRYDWVVDMIQHYDVREVHRRFPGLLAVVEAAEVETFNLKHRTASGPAEEALLQLRTMGAQLLYRLKEASDGGGRIILGAASVAGSTAADVLVEVAERYANLPDNARKLATAEADECDLFIWVESAHHQAVAAMAFEVLPERVPTLPDHVDAVWLATAYDAPQVWRYVRRLGWQDLGTWRLRE